MNKVYVLKVKHHPGWDAIYSITVIAESEDEARLMADEADGDCGMWLDEAFASCEERPLPSKGVVMTETTGG